MISDDLRSLLAEANDIISKHVRSGDDWTAGNIKNLQDRITEVLSMPVIPGLDDVTAVLLADGWHAVKDRTFVRGAYDGEGMLWDGVVWHTPEGNWISCPLTSVLAVRWKFHQTGRMETPPRSTSTHDPPPV